MGEGLQQEEARPWACRSVVKELEPGPGPGPGPGRGRSARPHNSSEGGQVLKTNVNVITDLPRSVVPWSRNPISSATYRPRDQRQRRSRPGRKNNRVTTASCKWNAQVNSETQTPFFRIFHDALPLRTEISNGYYADTLLNFKKIPRLNAFYEQQQLLSLIIMALKTDGKCSGFLLVD